MNKRISSTNEKIYSAFKEVLTKKEYNDVKIQDILDFSGVSRSTFYSHYKTKEDVLKSICKNIFGHVFSHTLEEEKSHDFSKSSIFDYKHFITHILYHLHDEKELMHAIFLSQSREIFLNFLRDEMKNFSTACVENNFVKKRNIPDSLSVGIVIESFILLVRYWNDTDFSETPETLTEYFISFNT